MSFSTGNTHSDTHTNTHLWAEGQGHWWVLWHPNFSLSLHLSTSLCQLLWRWEPKAVTDLMGQGKIRGRKGGVGMAGNGGDTAKQGGGQLKGGQWEGDEACQRDKFGLLDEGLSDEEWKRGKPWSNWVLCHLCDDVSHFYHHFTVNLCNKRILKGCNITTVSSSCSSFSSPMM